MALPRPKQTASPAMSMLSAEVESVADGEIRIAAGGERFVATRAVSCLVEPKAGDRVLCAIDPEKVFVLAVLERDGDQPVELRASGDLVMALGGSLRVAAQQGVELTGDRVSIAGRTLEVSASAGELFVRSLRFVGERAALHLEATSLVSKVMDAFHERFTQKSDRSLRVVNEMDLVRAEAIDYSAQTTARVHGTNTFVTATELAKVNGKQIHLG